MSLPTSRLSYEDCFEAFDRALADPRGVRIKMIDHDKATHLRMRMNYARVIDRKDNAALYADSPDHPMYGRSAYDPLTVRIKPVGRHFWLYIEPNTIPGEIEGLSGVPEEEIEYAEVQRLEAPRQEVIPPPRLMIEQIKRRI